MTEKQRRSALFLALAGVVAWSGWLALNEPATEAETVPAKVVRPVVHAGRPDPAAMGTAPAKARTSPHEAAPRLALSRANLFPEQTWVRPPPPPPPTPYVAPPPPQAPALPYSYMGRWQEAGQQTTYYLTRGNTPVSVQAGQVLDGAWRLEQVANGMLNFTYLPLNQTRSLRTGD